MSAHEAASDKPTDARERLRTHFLDPDTSKHPDLWDKLYETGDFLPWDRGSPNPAFEDILSQKKDLIGPPNINGQRKKALVPGCGRGHDVLLLSSFGYDAYGLEASSNAIKACEKVADEERHKYPSLDAEIGTGKAKFVFGDFFKNDKEWVEGRGTGKGEWDLIYDYTYQLQFLSALPPSLRPAWSARLTELLAPNGHLICLEFPTYKPASTGGPPWGLPPKVYENHLSHPGEEIKYGEDEECPPWDGKVSEKGLKRIAHWQPERTHEIGKGTDWVSVWTH